ncbi:hypothetical protein C1H46_027383 [Malus baccata]|uniref:NAC domain-containing protein n=1 Tax=Malus baccata TaxID=106549 RepID=A0A540LKQ1_MALBA|nr:hypothetical protein C1H46_027383 [Malus baccata]
MEDLPPGFRFSPTEEELISFYLQKKLDGRKAAGEAIHGDPEQWFFFIPRQESEARGGRPRRLTTTGYWKATGSPSTVYSSNSNHYRAIGLKRTMLRQEFSLCRVYKKSKCLRAFDRRPPGIEITRNPTLNIQAAPAQAADHLDQGLTTSNRNPQNMEGRTNSSSPESSSSGGNSFQSSQPEQSGTLPMAVDNEAIWDLDQLINFLL